MPMWYSGFPGWSPSCATLARRWSIFTSLVIGDVVVESWTQTLSETYCFDLHRHQLGSIRILRGIGGRFSSSLSSRTSQTVEYAPCPSFERIRHWFLKTPPMLMG
jgi:hypothetical protein